MIIYPFLVAILNAIFATVVWRQFVNRRRPHQFVWTVALLLGCLAALFYLLFLAFAHNDVLFKLYYICGALLMAAYLGLGSVYLHAPRAAANWTAGILIAGSVMGIVLLMAANVDQIRLDAAAATVGPGTNAIASGPWKTLVAILNSFGALAVMGGAAYSAWVTAKRRAPANFLYANVLIALGTFVAALAGGFADQGTFAGAFWVVLALGFVVLFAGFLLTMPDIYRSKRLLSLGGEN